MKRANLSVCMIVKNESSNLEALLPQVKKFADEIVIVDTGSTDSTKEVARRYTSRVFDFKWKDDFSAARNYGLSLARGDYFLWLDADDRVPDESVVAINRLKGYFDGKKCFYFVLKDIRTVRDRAVPYAYLKQIRCAPLLKEIRFQGRIHENFMSSLREAGCIPVSTNIEIEHYGYDNPELLRKKIRRNLRILLLEKPYRREDISYIFLLAMTYESMGMFKDAYNELLSYLRTHFVKVVKQYSGLLFEFYVLLAELARGKGDKNYALRWLIKGLACGREDKVALYRIGKLWEWLGHFDRALECFAKMSSASLKIDTMPVLAPPERGEWFLRLAYCWWELGTLKEYEACFVKALNEGISEVDAYIWLANHAFVLGRIETAEKILCDAVEKGCGSGRIYALFGNILSLKRDHSRAEFFLSRALKAEPDSLDVKLAIAWHYLRIGKIYEAQRAFEELDVKGEYDLDILVGKLVSAFLSGKDFFKLLEKDGTKTSEDFMKELILKLQAEGKFYLVPYVNFIKRNLFKVFSGDHRISN